MNRGHIVLVAGAVAFIVGIAIAAAGGTAFTGAFLSQNTLTKNAAVDPGRSIDAQTTVTALDKPISVAINVAPAGQAASFRAMVIDPSGNVVSKNDFTNSLFTTVEPSTTGVYTLTMTNTGTQAASVNAAFGHLPFMGANGKPDFSAPDSRDIVMLTVGTSLAGAGVLMLIGGGVLTYMERKRSSTYGQSATEGGVTYRKD